MYLFSNQNILPLAKGSETIDCYPLHKCYYYMQPTTGTMKHSLIMYMKACFGSTFSNFVIHSLVYCSSSIVYDVFNKFQSCLVYQGNPLHCCFGCRISKESNIGRREAFPNK